MPSWASPLPPNPPAWRQVMCVRDCSKQLRQALSHIIGETPEAVRFVQAHVGTNVNADLIAELRRHGGTMQDASRAPSPRHGMFSFHSPLPPPGIRRPHAVPEGRAEGAERRRGCRAG